MDPETFYGRPRPLQPASVQLVANNVYAQVRQLLKFPKRGRRVCFIRENIRLRDAGYFKGSTLEDVIKLASVNVCPEWWVRYINEHGDANELSSKAAAVQIRRHRRETQWVKTTDWSASGEAGPWCLPTSKGESPAALIGGQRLPKKLASDRRAVSSAETVHVRMCIAYIYKLAQFAVLSFSLKI